MSIQEENTRQLSRLVKQQEETISKLKVLVREAFHDGYEWHDEFENESWDMSETKEDLERL